MNLLSCLMAVCWTAAACSTHAVDPIDVSRYLADWRTLAPSTTTPPNPSPVQRVGSRSTSLGLSDAVAVALVSNPALRALRLKAGAARAGADLAGSWDNPVLSSEFRAAVDGAPNPWFINAGLAFTVPLSGRHGLRRDVAMASATVEQLTVIAQERALTTQIRHAWLDWSRATRQAELRQAYVASLSRIESIAVRLGAAGELPLGERRVLTIEKSHASIDLDRARLDARMQRGQLLALVGLSPKANVSLTATLELPARDRSQAPTATREDAIDRWASRHITVRLAQAGIDVAARVARLQTARRSPDLSIGPTVEFDGGSTSVGVGLSLPIPSLNLNRANIERARRQQRVARARTELAIQRVTWARTRQLERLKSAQDRVAKLTALETETAAQLAQVERLAAQGELNTLLVRHAMREALAVRLAILDTRHAVSAARAELIALGGAP